MSISPTFYEQLFCTQVSCSAFLCLQFGFVIFCQKEIGAKATGEILVKLSSCYSRVQFLAATAAAPAADPKQATKRVANATISHVLGSASIIKSDLLQLKILHDQIIVKVDYRDPSRKKYNYYVSLKNYNYTVLS